MLVEGIEAYKVCKNYMKAVMPSHAKKVQQFKDDEPIFNHYKVDTQLDTMLERRVDLKSGGHLIIDTTEALVAIDVNSGRSTRERNIEETALKTNLEAAEETARQLKLRDLAGLIVIDFIDMNEYKNNRSVERKLKEALKTDRARIQVGRISSFGLLEMSRQRLRTSLIEANSETCIKCRGTGLVRSVESSALKVLRAIEEESHKGKNYLIKVEAPNEVALYLLNHKRASIQSLETFYSVEININSNHEINPPDFEIDRIIKNKDQNAKGEIKKETSGEESSKNNKRRRRGKRGGKKKKNDEEEKLTTRSQDEKNSKTQKKLNLQSENEIADKTNSANLKNKQNVKKKSRRPKRDFKNQKKDTEENSINSESLKTNLKSKTVTEDKIETKSTRKRNTKKTPSKENVKNNSDDKNDESSENKVKRVGWWNK